MRERMGTKTKLRCRVMTVEIEGDPATAAEILTSLMSGLAPSPRLPPARRRRQRAKKTSRAKTSTAD